MSMPHSEVKECENHQSWRDLIIGGGGDTVKVGTPTVDGAKVEASVVSEGKGKKVIVYKYKRKTGYHKKNGHRQLFTQVKIDSIVG